MYLDNNVHRTKSGIYVRYDESVGSFAFSPYTGIVYGINFQDSDRVVSWLECESESVDKSYYDTLGVGFKYPIENAIFEDDRLLPNPKLWSDVMFLPKPLVINWLITGKCTHNCIYCYASDMMWNNAEEPNEDIIRETASNILTLNPLVVVLSGGEPLQSPFLKLIVELLANRVGIIIDTNGFLWNDDHIELFRKYNIVVRISLDSQRPVINDKYRMVRGSKKNHVYGGSKAISLLNRCLDDGIACVVHTVVTKDNINDLVAMGERYVSLGLKVWRICRLAYANDKPTIQDKCGYDEKKYAHFYDIIHRRAMNTWHRKMQVIIQKNLERERNSVILVSPSGVFMTESPIYGAGKVVIDTTSPKHPSELHLIRRINWWGHYNRYLNFE